MRTLSMSSTPTSSIFPGSCCSTLVSMHCSFAGNERGMVNIRIWRFVPASMWVGLLLSGSDGHTLRSFRLCNIAATPISRLQGCVPHGWQGVQAGRLVLKMPSLVLSTLYHGIVQYGPFEAEISPMIIVHSWN